ncbi:cyclic nucleotide-binding domain protein (macronuclear) [Tetrahymena thermophila SB210]|uniref:Cyclic nucleotide-binding domain protein n=1 Tax=Tetrahymena thermophila (strain SB210) TaxID=312017 RepID=Q248E7_TETTS|nr:cyclic nucleotide-binding domain protein [Tetrahymena thermophila SB210]EAS04098.2 cyclic nucleotide-binding domain protein [Tetrahymena thermophila SB210]|eukprot:XP_001024343.2 cyclic nucleotide-binding domain protein [Tetrahymena thermophila SB210]
MNREYQSADRALQNQNKETFKLVINQAKQISDEQEYHQSRLETKNTTMFSFQDQSAINKSSNENSNNEKITLFSPPPLSQKDGQAFFQPIKQNKNHFQLKLKPLVVPITKRQNSQDQLPQSFNQITSPERQLTFQKQNSIICQELVQQQFQSIQKLQAYQNEGNDEVSSPNKNKLQLLIEKQVIDFSSEEDVNWIIRIAKKSHKTKMELAYFRKFAYQFQVLEECLKNLEKDNISQEIFNQFKLMMYNPNRIIQKIEEAFYIVLRGSLVQKEKVINDNSESQDQNIICANNLADDIDSGFQIQEFQQSNTDIFEDQEKYTTIKRYLPGDCFGDIRLDNNQFSRKPIIFTESECCIIEITKEGIQSILAKYKASELQESIDFFKSFSFFQDIPDYIIMKMIQSSLLKQFIRGDVVFQESDLVENIYFIKNGDVEISKLIDIEANQDTTTVTNKNQQIIIPLISSSSQIQSPLIKKKNKEVSPLKHNLILKKRIQLKILTQNSYFGQEEILQKIAKRESKAKVLSQQAQIYAINSTNFMTLIQKYSQLQKLIEENSLKEIAEQERKTLIKKVQGKIQSNDRFDQTFKFSQKSIYQTTGNTPKSQRDLKSPFLRHKSNILIEKSNTGRGMSQQFSSLVFDNNNKIAVNSNSHSNIYIPLQSQNTLEEIEMLPTSYKYNTKTMPNSNKNSPRLFKMESYLVSPNKRQLSQARLNQEIFSDLCEDHQQQSQTERKNISLNRLQSKVLNSEYTSPIFKKQISKANLSPQLIKLNSGQQDCSDNFHSASQRALNQNQSVYKQQPSKSITNFKAFDYNSQKKGNIFDQNGNPILMVQFNTDLDTQTNLFQQNSKQQKDEYSLQTQTLQNKKINLKAIFKSPLGKAKKNDRVRSQVQIDESLEKQQTIRNNDIQDKNQKIYYDLSPIKKEILSSLIEKHKLNKFDQGNHYIKHVSPLKQLPTHPEILSNIPKKFWKENQKIMEQNEIMVKSGSNINKRIYQRAGRKSDLPVHSYVDRNMEQIMQIARQQIQISPRLKNQNNEEFCSLNIGQINVQNLEQQMKCIQQK